MREEKATPPTLYEKGEREALERKMDRNFDSLGKKLDALIQQMGYRTLVIVALTVSVVALVMAVRR